MNFWRWYLKKCKDSLSCKEINEFLILVGSVIIALGIVGSIYASPWFLLLVPAGITTIAHAYWREFKK